jgi:dihydrofolate synthase/folylpolyglutamate synthase
VVIGPTATEPEEILLSMARGKGSPAERAYTIYEPLLQTFAGDGTLLFRFRRRGDGAVITIPCGLSADYQKGNIATALVSVDLMRKAGWEIPDRAVRDGFERVVTNTGILGRWQIIGYNPRSICDTAHNHAGIEAVMEQVRQIPRKKLHLVWGMVKGKELSSILSLIPKEALCYFTRSSVPRSLDPAELQREASAFGLEGSLFATVEEAYRAAEQKAGRDDLIFTGGSTFVVADLLTALGFGRDQPD